MRLHVLAGSSDATTYTIVCHATTPIGNNSAGFSWAAVVAAALKPSSILSVGTGPGQTTQQEVNDIAAGNVLEAQFQFVDDPAMSIATRNALLDQIATNCVDAMIAKLGAQLKWYGATRA